MRRRSLESGVTLVELMVTLTLLGMLTVLGLPSFVQWSKNSQIRTVAESLQGGLRMAQAEALRRNRSVILFFTNADPAAGVTSGASPTQSTATAAVNGRRWGLQTVPGFGESTGQYITGGMLTDVASAVAIDSGLTAICFNANGRPTAPAIVAVTGATCTMPAAAVPFDVTQTGAERPLRVMVSLGGQVRMCHPGVPLTATSPEGCLPP